MANARWLAFRDPGGRIARGMAYAFRAGPLDLLARPVPLGWQIHDLRTGCHLMNHHDLLAPPALSAAIEAAGRAYADPDACARVKIALAGLPTINPTTPT